MPVHGLVIGFGHATPVVSDSAFIAPNATVIGDVVIGAQASVWYGCVLRGDVNRIEIGARSNLQDGTIVHVSPGERPTVVGDDVLVGHGALLHGCEIRTAALVGIRAVALNGSVVDSGAALAAGAVLTEGSHVPSGELWGGVPARRIRALEQSRQDLIVEQAGHYVALAAAHDRALAAETNHHEEDR